MDKITQIIIREAIKVIDRMEKENIKRVGKEVYDAKFAGLIKYVRDGLNSSCVCCNDLDMYRTIIELVNDRVVKIVEHSCKCKAEERAKRSENKKEASLPIYDATREWQIVLGINKKNHKIEEPVKDSEDQIHVLMAKGDAYGYMASVMYKPSLIDPKELEKLSGFVDTGLPGYGVACDLDAKAYSFICRSFIPLRIKNNIEREASTLREIISHADVNAIRNALKHGFKLFKENSSKDMKLTEVKSKTKAKTKTKTKNKSKK